MAALVTSGANQLFVKWKESASVGLFESEVDGLRRLRDANAIRVPEVIAYDDFSEPSWLALEYVPATSSGQSREFGTRLAEGLARLHRENPSPTGMFGLERNNYLGSQPQSNRWTSTWHEFYAFERLTPQIERAKNLRLLSLERTRLLDTVVGKMEKLFEGFEPTPVLIHGDLWSGNFLAHDNQPVLIDPAVYYAEREVEIAYTELFGGFPTGFLTAYNANFPLGTGYQRRRPLHQIYPLLIHLNHFGETYGPALDDACRAAMRSVD